MKLLPCRLDAVLMWAFAVVSAGAADILPPGHRPLPVGVHALVGARVEVKPGMVLSNGTVVLRDGLIESVGTNVALPPDARVWDLKGRTVYAGFIDPCLTLGSAGGGAEGGAAGNGDDDKTAGGLKFFGTPGQERDPGLPGPGADTALVTPERRMSERYAPDPKALEKLREIGFTAACVAPNKGVFRGSSVLVTLGEGNPNDAVLQGDVFQHVALDRSGGREGAYPDSLMGMVSCLRQTFYDAGYYERRHAGYARNPGLARPEFNPSLLALTRAQKRKQMFMIEPRSALMVETVSRVGREFGLRFCLRSCGEEWRRPDIAKASSALFVVSLDFPELSKLPAEDDWADVSLDQLRAWDWAPENPAVLRRQGLEIALTTSGLSDLKLFRKNLRMAIDRGLSEQDALAALTVIPATLCGDEERLGTIEPAKLANLVVVEGSYFDPEARVQEVWVDGRRYASLPAPVKEAKQSKETKEAARGASEANSVQETTDGKVAEPAVPGEVKEAGKSDKAKQAIDKAVLRKKRLARAPLEGRGPLATPKAVLVQQATLWTCGPDGCLEDADLLVRGGKIVRVGRGLEIQPEDKPGLLVLDGRGRHVTPGLIDPHSHAMILGAVNESSIPSSAMTRIKDVINSESENIHRQLAGGVTGVYLFHGSANPIGGHTAFIKLREGATPQGLLFEAALPGLKFALGENVKQSSVEKGSSRYPVTRNSVRSFLQNRFLAARQYQANMTNAPAAGRMLPRRDLELDALVEVLEGKRLVHCHAYRQDEILMMLRLAEELRFKVATFEHVSEGYKVADEMARHGAAGSSFADWWAYKTEVYDGIPYSGALMRDRGVLVAYNSDSPELARHLNLEVAKAVKFGDVPEIEALKFSTWNAARALGVESRVGSLEPGKDADFVLWSKAPLDSGTVCQQTWVEGRKYFDIEQVQARAVALRQERANLVAKAKALLGDGGAPPGADTPEKKKFFRTSLEQQYDRATRRDLDEE